MDMLEIGFYSAVTVYGLIAVWTVLVRLRWLPTVLVRLVHRPMNRLGRIPVLGQALNAFRRHPLILGLVVAILAGVAVPYVIFSALWLVRAVAFGGAIALGIWAFFASEDEEGEMFPSASRLYHSRYGGGRIVPGYDVEADSSRPWL